MYHELANVLSNLIQTADGIRDALADAGLTTGQINLSGSPYDMWRQALEAADQNGVLPLLLSLLRARFRQNEQLFDAEIRYWTLKQANTPTPQGNLSRIERTIYDMQAQISGINIRLMYQERRIEGYEQTVASFSDTLARATRQRIIALVVAIITAAAVLLRELAEQFPNSP